MEIEEYIYISGFKTAYFWSENNRFVIGFKTFLK